MNTIREDQTGGEFHLPAFLRVLRVRGLEGTVGVKADALGFAIAWAPDVTVVVDGTTDLTAPTWVPVSTHVLAGGVAEFQDLEPASESARFYRLRSP